MMTMQTFLGLFLGGLMYIAFLFFTAELEKRKFVPELKEKTLYLELCADEGITAFQCYDGSYGATNKVLSFIQQFDTAFGGKEFTKSSKLRHVTMHFNKAARQRWVGLKTQGTHPRTWKLCQSTIIKQFLIEDARDEVLIAWRGLKLARGGSIQ